MKIQNALGDIVIGVGVFKKIVFQSLLESYGLVKMDDVNILNKYLGGDDKGIHIREDDTGITVDVFPVISYGMKIDQVSLNAQENIQYNFQQMLGVVPRGINIHVLGIHIE